MFQAPTTYDAKAVKKQWKEDTPQIMNRLVLLLENIEDFRSDVVESQVKSWITSEGLPFGKVMAPLRLLVVGAMQGPHVFDILELIGQEESMERIRRGVSVLG